MYPTHVVGPYVSYVPFPFFRDYFSAISFFFRKKNRLFQGKRSNNPPDHFILDRRLNQPLPSQIQHLNVI
jgi:hypothetical protein